jgi:hypothetical protein
MKAYQELNLKLKEVSDSEFIDIIINFTQQVNDWTYQKKILDYRKLFHLQKQEDFLRNT